jgi:hypothetical protein
LCQVSERALLTVWCGAVLCSAERAGGGRALCLTTANTFSGEPRGSSRSVARRPEAAWDDGCPSDRTAMGQSWRASVAAMAELLLRVTEGTCWAVGDFTGLKKC